MEPPISTPMNPQVGPTPKGPSSSLAKIEKQVQNFTAPSTATVEQKLKSAPESLSQNTRLAKAEGQGVIKSEGPVTIEKYAAACFQSLDHVDVASVQKFAAALKTGCEQVREEGGSKSEEQAFCKESVHAVIQETLQAKEAILKDLSISAEQKETKLTNLTYMAQSLIGLTNVQERFGARLGFHCLPHSLGVGTGSAQYYKGTPYEFAAFCAGANHDAVMDYQAAPNTVNVEAKGHQAGKDAVTKFHAKLNEGDRSIAGFTEKNTPELKGLKNQSEQRRNAGWAENNSEKESYEQMEMQIELLSKKMENPEGVSKQLESLKEFRQVAIQGTIPTKSNFAPPNFGKKLFTIGNVGILPSPPKLAKPDGVLDPHLDRVKDKVAGVVDRAIEKVKPDAPKFHEAVKDITEARAQKEEARFKLPSFLQPMSGFFLAEMPPFDEPFKGFDAPQEKMVAALAEEIVKEPEVFDYMFEQLKAIGTGVSDLGALMQEGAEKNWAVEETIALIVEENPYQAGMFFTVNQKLTAAGFLNGLSDKAIHEKLLDSQFREKCTISDAEYKGMQEFMRLTYYFAKDQKPFAEGRIELVQHYIYEPMKAMQSALKESPELKEKYQENLDKIVGNFEEAYCEKPLSLRKSSLAGIDSFLLENNTPEKLCGSIVSNMAARFGANFIKDPSGYGYTGPDSVDQGFLDDQKKKTEIMV